MDLEYGHSVYIHRYNKHILLYNWNYLELLRKLLKYELLVHNNP